MQQAPHDAPRIQLLTVAKTKLNSGSSTLPFPLFIVEMFFAFAIARSIPKTKFSVRNKPRVIMATYQHQPLHHPRNTRLIWLEPSESFPSPLRCRLFEVSLDENPVYEALSYCWGGPLDRTILCFNLPLSITANCEAALRQLRLSREPRVLWIDAICIDQTPGSEKDQQLRNMRDIH
jgi:hypothetical protein